MIIKTDTALTGKAVYVKCTWTAGYSDPVVSKATRVISYDKVMMKNGKIGTLTGRWTENNNVLWVEAVGVNCDRLDKIWFRVRDINPTLTINKTFSLSASTILLGLAALGLLISARKK